MQAAQLCRDCGQPWQAATLVPSAGHGLIPLGDAAVQVIAKLAPSRSSQRGCRVLLNDKGSAAISTAIITSCYTATCSQHHLKKVFPLAFVLLFIRP